MIAEFKKLKLTKYDDERGGVDKIFQNNVPIEISQFLISRTSKKNTFRGLHCQIGDFAERKFIYCLSGSLTWFALDFSSSDSTRQLDLRFRHLAAGEAIEVGEHNLNGMLSNANNTNIAIVASRPYVAEQGFNVDPRSVPDLWSFVMRACDNRPVFDEAREYLQVGEFLEEYAKWTKK
jgi:dTDP-4-dehydrorhamnose 3,5-epimerase-like enzyme